MSTLCMETIGVCNCFDMEILEGASIHSLAEAVKKKHKTKQANGGRGSKQQPVRDGTSLS